MSKDDRSTQHSANGVGGSNNPAANPGQDKPGKPLGNEATAVQPKERAHGKTDKNGGTSA